MKVTCLSFGLSYLGDTHQEGSGPTELQGQGVWWWVGESLEEEGGFLQNAGS